MHPARTFVLYKLLSGFAFGACSTVYAPLLLKRGLALSDLPLLAVVYWTVVVLLDIPASLLADSRKRLTFIRAGCLFQFLGTVVYAAVGGFASAAVAETVLGIGLALISGVEQAWVTDALARRGESAKLRRTFGSAALWCSAGLTVGGVIGALIGSVDLRLGWVLAGVFFLADALVAFIFMGDEGEPITREKRGTLAESVRVLRERGGLKWAVAAALAFDLILALNFFWAPYCLPRVGQKGLAAVWLLMNVTVVAGSWLARSKLFGRGREAVGVSWSLIAAGLGLACIGLWPGVAAPLAFLALHELGRGAFQPLLDTFVQKRVESGYRATYGSLQATLGRIGCVLVPLAVWLGASGGKAPEPTIVGVWLASGSLLALCGLALWLFRPRN